VALVDPAPLAPWRNNYGVWVDEFEAMGHGECFTRSWASARVLLSDEGPGLELRRAYAQVDRYKLKHKLLKGAADAGVEFLSSKVDGTAPAGHLNAVSVRALAQPLHARAVLDATGHARRLVRFDADFTPGYQAAYGILAEVESHPFPINEMLFMDWRDGHLEPAAKARNASLPTFIYVMPFSSTRVFMEETSLVARPGVDFDDIKLRMKQRLAGLGVTVTRVLEEEHCLIPMGGVLPELPQRTLGVGGTAGMVHPSTGFMLSKTLLSSSLLAQVLADSLQQGLVGDQLSAAVWDAVWPQEQRRMRTFMCFGMETLMQLDIEGTRRFFGTFFSLPNDLWSGFLSWRVRPIGLVGLGLSLFAGFSWRMRAEFILAALPFIPSFVANFLGPAAGNRFDSAPWGGLALPALRRPDPPALAQAQLVSAVSGRQQILPPNPTTVPILSSGTDFAALIGLQPALAGGLAAEEAEGSAQPATDYAALLGRDLDTPQPASASRDDRDWTRFQQRKAMPDQPPLAQLLPPASRDAATLHDVAVVGAGPAGMALAAELAARGLSVVLVAPDAPFVNNYGVWLDEFQALGLESALGNVYRDALYWVDEASPNEGLPIGRAYGRVDRAALRATLAQRALAAGVTFLPGLVSAVDNESAESLLSVEPEAGPPLTLRARLTVCASGHNRELLSYEDGKPPGWQTAYGIEARIPDHPFPIDKVVFMDFRQSDPEPDSPSSAPWRAPSFLYVMPSDKDTVFLEETCLMSRVQVPFDELKRRLLRRMARMGLQLDPKHILEEEASWIPLGGGLPVMPQRNVAFGAAAGMVHPASGFSVVNSLSRAPALADAIARALKSGATPAEVSAAGWAVVWNPERTRQMGFYQFGMELLLSLRLADVRCFFSTFYKLPDSLSQGFLSHRLSSPQLVLFALAFFVAGDGRLRLLLLSHLLSPAGSGMRLAAAYLAGEAPPGGRPAAAVVRREKPPQEPAQDVSAAEQAANERAGIQAGFLGSRWWVVGGDATRGR
jgi:lycopene cyclase-like protein